MASSPQQPLNGQGVQKISRYKFKNKKTIQIEIRIGTWNIGSLCGKGTKLAEELNKRNVDICGLKEVRCRGKRTRFIEV